jgi:hypothetical protein
MADSNSDQRRKKKYFLKTHASSPILHIRPLISFFVFVFFVYFFYFGFPFSPSFRPAAVIIPSGLSILSSNTDSVKRYSELSPPFRIEDRILFPDHVLLLLPVSVSNEWVKKVGDLECVYSSDSDDDVTVVKMDVVSMEDYDSFRFIVRCPLPPLNFSDAVSLQVRGSEGRLLRRRGTTARVWENLVYEAVLDGDTAVVFAKGLNLRHEKESDPTRFTCHFGLGSWERNGSYVLSTKAVTAAQEVVRCPLPRSFVNKPGKTPGIRVTLGAPRYVRGRPCERILLPSVAKISDTKSKTSTRKKYELCVCTMVWNQASYLREWVTYHAWLGVERWFIYDNNSDDKIKDVINELELENYNVSSHLWPWIKTQEAGFSHCALRARDECNWVSFMDVDEFFYFPVPTPLHRRPGQLGLPGKNSLKEVVTNISSSATIGEIRTACHSFGPSGLSSPPSQGVTAGYTCRLQSPERHKSIIRPDALDPTLLNVVHHFHLRKGFESMNLHQGIAVINHYKYQVWEAFRAKFYRRVATYVADWQENQNEGSKDRAPGLGTEAIEPPNWRLQFCEVWDTGLRDFVLANLANPETGTLPWQR